MKKYHVLMLLIIIIILGVTFTVTYPEFYEPIDQYPNVLQYAKIKKVAKEDTEMKQLLRVKANKFQLQPTVASTLGQVFILPQPDMPNYFISVLSDGIPGKNYISYTVSKIPR